MLGRGDLREEHGGAFRDERSLLKEAWWRCKTMLEKNIERRKAVTKIEKKKVDLNKNLEEEKL